MLAFAARTVVSVAGQPAWRALERAGRAGGRAADGASNVATPEWENRPSRCWGPAAAVQPS